MEGGSAREREKMGRAPPRASCPPPSASPCSRHPYPWGGGFPVTRNPPPHGFRPPTPLRARRDAAASGRSARSGPGPGAPRRRREDPPPRTRGEGRRHRGLPAGQRRTEAPPAAVARLGPRIPATRPEKSPRGPVRAAHGRGGGARPRRARGFPWRQRPAARLRRAAALVRRGGDGGGGELMCRYGRGSRRPGRQPAGPGPARPSVARPGRCSRRRPGDS